MARMKGFDSKPDGVCMYVGGGFAARSESDRDGIFHVGGFMVA